MTDGPKISMVVCVKCGALALPKFMLSVLDVEDKLAWICKDCVRMARKKEEPK